MLPRPMAAPGFTNLRLAREHAVATITLDRPRRLNALDTETLRELARAIRDVRRDAAARVLVVTSAGEKAFSAGADIAAMTAMSASEGHAYSRLGHEVLGRLEALPIPVIAAIDGVALGGGLELALACDLIVATERARFGQPEINLGLIPGFGGTQRLVRRIGQARARELIYLGHAISAEEALRIGLVTRVVSAPDLATEAARLAVDLAAKPPLALAQAKRATAVAADADLETGCRYEVEAFGVTFATEDRVEGLTAFTSKRAPLWKGR
jgi:enoyl-CoA hydratase